MLVALPRHESLSDFDTVIVKLLLKMHESLSDFDTVIVKLLLKMLDKISALVRHVL